MLRRTLALTVVLLMSAHAPARAQDIVYDVFSSYLDSLREQAGIPGLAAAIVDAEGIAWERAYGRQDIGRNIATRTDTPHHADGLTVVFTAAMVLRCVEEGRLSLDERIGSLGVATSEPDATIRQILTHTSGPSDNPTFGLRPDRFAPLWPLVRGCAVDSYRENLANLLKRLAMFDSVPGAEIVSVAPPAEGVPEPGDVERYLALLQRRATPYAVDDRGRASASAYAAGAAMLTPSSGLITTVRDLASFDLALRQNVLLFPETLEQAWNVPVNARGEALPHGLGWFVQNHNGEKVVWQFGLGENTSSSLMVTLPARGLTLILMANSDGLARLFSLSDGDVMRSPFARLFVTLFVR